MTASYIASPTVLKRYASALLDLAEKDNSIEAIQKDFNVLRGLIKESVELLKFVRSPLMSKIQQASIMNEVAKGQGFNSLTTNFLGVLVNNRRLYALEGVMDAFDTQVSVRRGEVSVRVETAFELSKKQKEDLSQKISSALGKDVAIEEYVVPEILGGMVVTIGSFMIDDSVRRKLERLGGALAGSANQNTIQTMKEVV